MRRMGENIGATLPVGWGFMLTLFEYQPYGSFFYISSGDRHGVIESLKKFIEREEAKAKL